MRFLVPNQADPLLRNRGVPNTEDLLPRIHALIGKLLENLVSGPTQYSIDDVFNGPSPQCSGWGSFFNVVVVRY